MSILLWTEHSCAGVPVDNRGRAETGVARVTVWGGEHRQVDKTTVEGSSLPSGAERGNTMDDHVHGHRHCSSPPETVPAPPTVRGLTRNPRGRRPGPKVPLHFPVAIATEDGSTDE